MPTLNEFLEKALKDVDVSESETLDMDTLNSNGRLRVVFGKNKNMISILSGTNEVMLNRQEASFLIRSLNKRGIKG